MIVNFTIDAHCFQSLNAVPSSTTSDNLKENAPRKSHSIQQSVQPTFTIHLDEKENVKPKNDSSELQCQSAVPTIRPVLAEIQEKAIGIFFQFEH